MLLASQDRLLSPATQKTKNKLEIERSEGTLRGPRRPKMTNTQLQIQLRGIEQQLDSQGRSKSP